MNGRLLMLNNQNKDTWCVNPYLHLAIEPSGEMIPCCVNVKHYRTDSGSKTFAEESILNFWNSKDRKELINQLENGIKAKGCKNCWQEEAAGKESKRIRDNREWAHINLKEVQTPVSMYLALGNLCNLKCRICHGDRSSVFADEETKISWVNKALLNVFHNQTTGRKSFSPDNEKFWDEILPLLSNVKRLDFSGGEPLYVKNHWKIIKHVVGNNLSKDQVLHYNTNGTIFPEQYINLLNTFKSVDFCISIDAIDKKFEYIRHPANFAEVNANIDKFVAARDTAPNVWSLQSTMSVSIFSIWDIAETYEYCRDKTLMMYMNFVHDDRSIKFMPRGLKDAIIERLLKHTSKYLDWIQNRDIIIAYLNNSKYNAIQWKLFWREVKQRDAYRKESFAETFPDYYEEIKKWLT